MPPKKAAGGAKKPRVSRKKAAPGSRGLSPAECKDASLPELAAKIESSGGAVLSCYKEPLGGQATIVAILPIDKVKPTPFQRDLSDSHAKRLTDTIGKIGRFLDPIIAVNVGDEFWTPNGRHRLESMIRLGAKSRLTALKELGAKTLLALLVPEPEVAYKILALNIEKAHNLREKSLEVIRMYRALVAVDDALESARVLEFEEPGFATLGICYEKNGRFSGGAYNPILKRVDLWIEDPLPKALKAREARAAKIERLDARVTEVITALQEKGFKSPYLRAFVVARVNPLRFMKTLPPFDEALDDIIRRADKFNVGNVKQEDISASAGAAAEGE